MSRYILRKLICTVWGSVAALAAALWCIGGAGIYGSPLPGMGKEAWFFVAYFVWGAGCAFMAGLTVWTRPMLASRFLFVGGLLSSLIAGRYLWEDPVYTVLAFGLPGIMILLAWTTSGIEKRGSSEKLAQGRPSTRPTFTLATLFVLCAFIALALAHGRIARVPSYMPTLLMQEFSGNLLPDSVGILENMRREQRDAEQFLQQEYGIRLGSIGAGGGGRGQHVEMQLNRSRHHSERRNRSTLVVDLENAMHKLVRERGLMIEHEGQSSGSLLTERGLPDGFWIRYRARDVEGLIQAGARPDQQGAIMIIEERTRRNCLSIGKSHYDPRLQDW